MKKLKITLLGKTYEVLVEDMGEVNDPSAHYAERTPMPVTVPLAPIESNTATEVSAPMNGTVLEIAVSVGTEVSAGDRLLVLEAMKMKNTIPAPVNGTVRQIFTHVGDNVSTGTILFVLD